MLQAVARRKVDSAARHQGSRTERGKRTQVSCKGNKWCMCYLILSCYFSLNLKTCIIIISKKTPSYAWIDRWLEARETTAVFLLSVL